MESKLKYWWAVVDLCWLSMSENFEPVPNNEWRRRFRYDYSVFSRKKCMAVWTDLGWMPDAAER